METVFFQALTLINGGKFHRGTLKIKADSFCSDVLFVGFFLIKKTKTRRRLKTEPK